MPVGPELPPHLQKRKRSIAEDDPVSSPPPKVRAVTPPKERRILGPAPPPAELSERPSHPPSAVEADVKFDSDSSDDDDFGPSLPPVPGSAAYHAAQAKEEREAQARIITGSSSTETAKPQRADWMLVPPSDSDWTGRIDPTKLKNRKFTSGKGSKAPTEKGGISAIWTETPEQKRQRLEDEVLGRKDKSVNGPERKHRDGGASKEEQATARRIKEYNEKNRGKTLMEIKETEAGGKKEEEDDPSKRAFDREKDMALGGRMGHMQKKELLKKAGDFGSRFEKGNYL